MQDFALRGGACLGRGVSREEVSEPGRLRPGGRKGLAEELPGHDVSELVLIDHAITVLVDVLSMRSLSRVKSTL